MKNIVLAKKSRRILAGLIDFLILMITTLAIFLGLVLPFTLDAETYRDNGLKIIDIHQESGLYITDKDKGIFMEKNRNSAPFIKLENLYDADIKFGEDIYQHQNLSKDLATFYLEKYDQFGGEVNLSKEIYEKDILKVGTPDSNIKSIDYITYAITCIDNEKADLTIRFFLQQYRNAAVRVNKCPRVEMLHNANEDIMFGVLIWILPILVGCGLIFTLIIPLCNRQNKTIGKFIFKLGVIGKDGYTLKKPKLILRSLAYIFIEVILGLITFGGVFLISYTMFLFSKNRRSIHDFIAGTVVIDAEESLYFDNAAEERFYKSRGLVNND